MQSAHQRAVITSLTSYYRGFACFIFGMATSSSSLKSSMLTICMHSDLTGQKHLPQLQAVTLLSIRC